MTPSSPDPRFHIEVVKLLLQVATSDGHITPEEVEHLVATARAMSVPLDELATVTQCLKDGRPLPPPNLGMLRADPEAVLHAARMLMASDRHLDGSEIEMLRQLRELLGVTR
ncbi:TerB family tellurite resistance protein [Pyxidicoccus fallax]|uniref:TerB family tellurite resistance protein n=1 Tax=Pyxidicoccus fallax TaxID=394095 RepID=A0A848LU97_9BACT|nr:TerB family tellurite resistance protein [Pyxidicoccus fallax]NMO21535.1 TerB family tellurite resistance protein [Pyxidicoccus fallax]NPC85005.1 TerB family tellurite resistance protein [Pyxidicoccus fallax]